MKKLITLFTSVLLIACYASQSFAQLKYSPYGVDTTIYLTEPTPGSYPPPPPGAYPNAPPGAYPPPPPGAYPYVPPPPGAYQGAPGTSPYAPPPGGYHDGLPPGINPGGYPGGYPGSPESNGCCGVNAATAPLGGYYTQPCVDSKGYRGVYCAYEAGKVASISVCEMVAAAAIVGAIAVIALVFSGSNGHFSH